MLSLRLAALTLKKKKDTSIVLMVFILLAVMFMIMGISVNNRAENLFFHKTQELQSAHFLVPCTANTYRMEYENYILEKEDIECFEKEEVVFMPTITNNRNELELGAFFFDKDAERKIAPLILIEEDSSIPEDKAIYVPIQLKSENVLLGQDYTIHYKGKDWSFVVAGYFQTTSYSNINSGFYKYFVSGKVYQQMSNEVGKAYMLSTRFQGSEEEIAALSEQVKKGFLQNTQYASDTKIILQEALDYKTMRERSILNLMIGNALLFGISILICIVVSFIMMNYIKEDIHKATTDLGTLQAIGYTLGQIRKAYLLEYGIIGLFGGVLGIVASYLGMTFLKPFLTNLCGFIWPDFFHPAEDAISFCIILILTLVVCVISIRSLKDLTPVDALTRRREGKSRYAASTPLQKGRFSLNFQMALKNVQIYKKNNLLFSLIVAISSFAIGMTLIIYLNFSAHTDALLQITGIELTDLQIKTMQGCDLDSFSKELEAYPEVRKSNKTSTGGYLKYEQEKVTTIIVEDYDKLEFVKPYEGDLPRTDNEVLISSELSTQSGMKTGDSIRLSANGVEKSFMVSGVIASTNGFVVYMTYDGIRLLHPEFAYDCIELYLEEQADAEEFIAFLQQTYKNSSDFSSTSIAEEKIARLLSDYHVSSVSYSIWKDGVEICSGNSSAFRISDITKMKSFAEGQIASYSEILSTIVLIVFITMLIVIGGVLRVMCKAEVKKNRKDYGVLKALGYTTGDIVRQLSARFLITSIAGSLLGTFMALLLAPSMFRLLFSMMGVTQITVNGYPMILLLYSCVLSIVLYLVTLLNAYSIKAISAYELMSE